MSRLCMMSINDRGNLGARQLVAEAKGLGHQAFLVNFGEYQHQTYQVSESADSAASFAALKEVVADIKPDIIGISYRSAMAELAPVVAGVARSAAPEARVMAGGIGPTSEPESAQAWAELVHVGEGDEALAGLLNDKGWGREPGRKAARTYGRLCEDLNTLPFPDYEGNTTTTIVRGQTIHPDGRLDNDLGAYPLLTSRGCVRNCSYCHNSTVHALYKGQRYNRQRSVGNVMQEIREAIQRWDIKLLSIYDDLFIANPDWALEFAREFPKVWPTDRAVLVPTLMGGPQIRNMPEMRPRRYWFMCHPCYVREDVIAAMAGSGAEEICLGVQSGSPRILDLYRRGTSIEEIKAATETLAKFNVAVKIDIITANPLETMEDIVATMKLVQSMPLKPSWHSGLSRLTIFPGAGLAEKLTEEQCQGLHNARQDFIDGLFRGAFLPRWYKLDLAKAVTRYEDFLRWTRKKGLTWPGATGSLDDGFWNPLTEWLDGGMA